MEESKKEKKKRIILLVGRQPQSLVKESRKDPSSTQKKSTYPDTNSFEQSLLNNSVQSIKPALQQAQPVQHTFQIREIGHQNNLQAKNEIKLTEIKDENDEEVEVEGEESEDDGNLSRYTDENDEEYEARINQRQLQMNITHDQNSSIFIDNVASNTFHMTQQNQTSLQNAYSQNILNYDVQSSNSVGYGGNYFSGGSLPIFDRVHTAQQMGKQRRTIFKNANSKLNILSKNLNSYQNDLMYITEYNKNSLILGSHDLQPNKRPTTVYSNFGRVRSKILQPTLSIQQQHNLKSIAEKSFITSDPMKFVSFSSYPKSLENVQLLSHHQIEELLDCLTVAPARIYPLESFNEYYYSIYGKNFTQDPDPNPVCFYEKDPRTGEYKVDKLKNILPKGPAQPEEGPKLSQKERNDISKNLKAKEVMENLILTMKQRDTKSNILQLQNELDELAARNNPLKKCLSMYKIKQIMDQLQDQKIANDAGDGNQKGDGSKSGQHLKKEMSVVDQGRMRYKVLTNFVNAYKEKMFLSGSSGGEGKAQGDDKEQLSLADMKEMVKAERSDITLDFEQFMRIYNFEKNRSSNIKNTIMPLSNQDKKKTQLSPQSPVDKTPYGSNMKYKREKVNYHQPNLNASSIISRDSSTGKRPISTYSKGISDQKRKLMKKTNEIKQSVDGNKSLIEDARQKKRKEEDDKEIARQVEQIKQNFHKRTSKISSNTGRAGTASTSQGYNLLNRMSQSQMSDLSPKERGITHSGFGLIAQDGSVKKIRLLSPSQQSRPPTSGFAMVNFNQNGTHNFDADSTFDKVRQLSQYQNMQSKSIPHSLNRSLQNATKLANLYGNCINEMNMNLGMKAVMHNATNLYRKDVRNVNEQIQNISKNIRAEQIKYRKFDNYTKC